MEYKELFNPHLAGEIDLLLEWRSLRDPGSPSVSLSYRSQIGDEATLHKIHSICFLQEEDIPFSLTLEIGDPDGKRPDLSSAFTIIANLICCLNYEKILNRVLINHIDRSVNSGVIVSDLRRFLASQGFDNILFHKIEPDSVRETAELSFLYYAPKEGADISSVLPALKQAVTTDDYSPQLLILVEDQVPRHLGESLVSLDSALRSGIEDPSIYSRIYSATLEKKQYEDLIRSLKEEASSKETYVNFLKKLIYTPPLGEEEGQVQPNGQMLSENTKIIRFYHYEYEILPKWYKQFGHIIKVLMGKRTFGSLFNDNVKKYKG